MTQQITTSFTDDERFMDIALEEARLAAQEGEVPIGACVVFGGEVIARAHNRRETDKNPCGHAEFLAMQKAARRLDRWRLDGCTVYVTLEPCLMCAGLMVNSRVDRCVYGAADPKAGALGTLFDVSADERLNHSFEVVGGVKQDEASEVLRSFFKMRREQNKRAKQEMGVTKTEKKSKDLQDFRSQIDALDAELVDILSTRFCVTDAVGRLKAHEGTAVFDAKREDEKLESLKELALQDIQDELAQIFVTIMNLSKDRQRRIVQDESDARTSPSPK